MDTIYVIFRIDDDTKYQPVFVGEGAIAIHDEYVCALKDCGIREWGAILYAYSCRKPMSNALVCAIKERVNKGL